VIYQRKAADLLQKHRTLISRFRALENAGVVTLGDQSSVKELKKWDAELELHMQSKKNNQPSQKI
jgi:hypothetical protein